MALAKMCNLAKAFLLSTLSNPLVETRGYSLLIFVELLAGRDLFRIFTIARVPYS